MSDVIRPDPDCPHCHGEGWISNPNTINSSSLNGSSHTCRCIVHQRVKHYLREWKNESISWDKDFDLARFKTLLQSDLIFIKQYPLQLFRERIKSFLIHQWQRSFHCFVRRAIFRMAPKFRGEFPEDISTTKRGPTHDELARV
jgi:hypothetical protein